MFTSVIMFFAGYGATSAVFDVADAISNSDLRGKTKRAAIKGAHVAGRKVGKVQRSLKAAAKAMKEGEANA